MLYHSPWFSLAPYAEIPLTQLLAPAAERFRDKPAFLTPEGEGYTFGEAWQASRRLGRDLQDSGIQKGDRIAILSANCPEYFVAFYGTLFAGGVVTTLNPLYKEREVLHQVEDCGARAAFAMGPLQPLVHGVREHLPELRHVFAIEDVWSLAADAKGDPDPVSFNPKEDLAALPYSSGTTGLPKGVMLSHYNLVSNVRQTLSTGMSSSYSVLLDFLPFYHIYGTVVLQGYGMTETSPVTNVNPVNRIKDATVGPPIADTVEKVVSLDDGRELGVGEVGELLTFGPQVMQGYWQRPEETAETLPGGGWIRTGDIVQCDEEGYVTILDRKKEMIKYKGYQIAPAELEALLMEHPAVMDSAVIPKRDAESGEIPKAFVLLRQGQEASVQDLMRFVEERVAPYKKVREIEFVQAIPKTPSGKILRRELIEQERAKTPA